MATHAGYTCAERTTTWPRLTLPCGAQSMRLLCVCPGRAILARAACTYYRHSIMPLLAQQTRPSPHQVRQCVEVKPTRHAAAATTGHRTRHFFPEINAHPHGRAPSRAAIDPYDIARRYYAGVSNLTSSSWRVVTAAAPVQSQSTWPAIFAMLDGSMLGSGVVTPGKTTGRRFSASDSCVAQKIRSREISQALQRVGTVPPRYYADHRPLSSTRWRAPRCRH